MRLCMFSPKGMQLDRGWPGRIDGDRIVQLAAQTLQAFFTGGGGAREHAEYPLADCDLRAPVLAPPAVRVFRTAGSGTPFFSFRSPFPVLAPEEGLRIPAGVEELDYGLALAAMVGADGALGGITLANDWTARDLERDERAAGFGPSKSRDFGLSLGPVLATLDEPPPGALVARVNGEERSRVEASELVASWERLRAHAAEGTVLRPGDLLLVVAPAEPRPPLRAGDVVELEAGGIGILRSPVV